MTVVIFVGPTLTAEEVRAELDAVVLPPAAQGDVYQAARARPAAIGIVDGYFEHQPAIWHKEILWAMAEGVHVFGSASMGALRAAELHTFGMEGAGTIFAAYRDGVIEDDDEVAVAHGSAEEAFRPLSEAMVNIRATLDRARASDTITAASRVVLERIAKDLYYPDRTYPAIVRHAAGAGVPVGELDALRAWLPAGRVDQKRTDALAMLRLMRARIEQGLPAKRVTYHFEHTVFWEHLTREAGTRTLTDGASVGDVLDEVRLCPGALQAAQSGALARALAVEVTRSRGVAADAGAVTHTAEQFRLARGLIEPEDVARWLRENGLTEDQFERLMEEETLLAWARAWAAGILIPRLLDHLRVSHAYPAVTARAREKAATLARYGLTAPSLADAGPREEELYRWYFEERLGRSVPASVARFATSLGYDSEMTFRTALLREYCYLAISQRDADTHRAP
jgi:hypothetical protein